MMQTAHCSIVGALAHEAPFAVLEAHPPGAHSPRNSPKRRLS